MNLPFNITLDSLKDVQMPFALDWKSFAVGIVLAVFVVFALMYITNSIKDIMRKKKHNFLGLKASLKELSGAADTINKQSIEIKQIIEELEK